MWGIHTWGMTHLYVWPNPFICVHICVTYARHDSYIRVTWLIHTCDITHVYVWPNSFICVTWLAHLQYVGAEHSRRASPRSHVWHDSFTRVTWLMYNRLAPGTLGVPRLSLLSMFVDAVMSGRVKDLVIAPVSVQYDSLVQVVRVWHDSLMCVTWLTRVCDILTRVRDVPHLCVWHDSLVCVTWLVYVCDMTHCTRVCAVWQSCAGSVCVTWLTRVCDMTRSRVWHDVFVCVTWLIYVCDMTHCACECAVWLSCAGSVCVTWLTRVCDMTHSCVWHDSLVCVT